jgi:hypothetical protein
MTTEVVFTRKLSARDAEAYDAFVDRARGGAWAQARAWAPVAIAHRRVSPRWLLVRRGGEVIGAALVLKPRLAGPFTLPSALVERGPVVDDLAELPGVLGALRRACPGRVQVMPYWADEDADRAERILADAGFRSVHTFDSAHARTVRVSLAGKTEATLFSGKEGSAVRSRMRQAEKGGVTVRRGTVADLATFARLDEEVMALQGLRPKPRATWNALRTIVERGERGAVFLCDYEGKAISAVFASRHGSLANYVMGASVTASMIVSKTVLGLAAAIRWAHAEGCHAFDMGGIPLEDDPDEKRRGIAHFKLEFAKTPVRLTHEHARWL